MERVGTYHSYNQLVQYGAKLQVTVFEQQQKLATSLKGEHFDDLPSQNLLIQNTQNELLKNEGYQRSTQIKLDEIQTKHAGLQKISDLLRRAKTLATDALGASTDQQKFTSVNQTAELLLKDLESLLNSQHDGSYLFGGTDTDREPVKIKHSTFAPQKAPSTTDTKYYLSNDKSKSINIADNRTVEDDVNAKDPAIEKAIRAIAILTGVKPTERDSIKESFRLLGDGITGVARLLTKTGSMAKTIKDTINNNKAVQLQTEATLSRLTKTDAAQVMADLANLQVVLQASFSSVAKNNEMSLLKYLR